VEVTFDSSQVIAATRLGYLCGIFFEESWLQRGKKQQHANKNIILNGNNWRQKQLLFNFDSWKFFFVKP